MLTLQHKVEFYERLLEQLSLQVDGPAQLAIQKAIGKVAHPPSPDTGGENSVNTDGSTDPFTYHQDDLCAQITDGIAKKVGKTTENVSLPQTTQNLSKSGTEGGLDTIENASNRKDGLSTPQIVRETSYLTAEMDLETPTYHMNDLDLSVVGDQIDPFALPQKNIADELVRNYFDTIQPTFPILFKKLFMAQYESFYKFPFTPESSKRWLAVLNAIFAIGAVYSHLVNPDNVEDEQDHLQFFTRARVLSLDGGVVYEVADLQQVQVAGLMGMYLMATSQTNRAWNITGLAIRYAQTLGLHLRQDNARISDSEREMRARIWYAINSLEKLLTVMTGRPSATQDKDCTAPMPKPMDEETAFLSENIVLECGLRTSEVAEGTEIAAPCGLQSNFPSANPEPARYLTPSTPSTSLPPAILYYSELSRVSKIAAEAINSLYCPETMKLSWFEVQQKIADLDERLKVWRAGLPPILDFVKHNSDTSLTRQRMTLAFQYYHTRIIMNRPCLCRSHGRSTESSQSKLFNRTAALACIESARDTVKLLPQVPNSVGLYQVSPWWSLFHYLVSAGSVIIVEIAMRAEHNPRQAGALLKDAKKLIYWLKVMGKENAAARRAHGVLSRLLSTAAPRLKLYGEGDTPNSGTISPMMGVENTQGVFHANLTATHGLNQGNPNTDPRRLSTYGLSIGDLEFLAAYDELPTLWGRNYDIPHHHTHSHAHPQSIINSTSMMFPTPQQMHGIDVEESLSRHDSILPQHPDNRHQRTPGYTEEYFSQWDTLDTVLGKRPYGNMPYPPQGGATKGEYSALAASELQLALPQSESQLEGVPSHVPVDDIDGIDGEADGTEDNEDPVSNVVSSPASNFPSSSQVNYHKQIREDIFRRQSQVGLAQAQQQQQQAQKHPHDRSKKRRESPS
ncbi:fungal-specific transcription factor domain-containing protein [Tirmania nivea]|nr:fungal-specific transcription factor domain-containing protein [Tirmania nivea]